MPRLTITETDGLRLLRFGTGWVQGAMRLDDPDRLELAYAVQMCAWLLFQPPDALPRLHLATLGLGAGSLTRHAHRVLGVQATAVEIDPAVIAACRAHFALPPDGDGLRVVQADARDWIAAPAQRASLDVLQLDAYDAAVEAPALDGEPLYAACRAALRPGGTLVANLVGARLDRRASVDALRRGLRPAAVWQFPPTDAAGNVVVVAPCGPLPGEAELAARAAAIEARWSLPARAWLASVRRGPGHPAG
jgi:spermidine synthase